MNDNERKMNLLRDENPFTSSSVGDPWGEKYLDVRSINERAFREISQLIDQKIRNPALPCAGLAFGEVGSGKTHLISRILKYDRTSEFRFSFAYIQPIEDSEQTYRYLLRELIVNLCYPIHTTSGKTQLDIILEKSFREVSQDDAPPSDPESLGDFLEEFRKGPVQAFRNKKLVLGMFRELGETVKAFMGKNPLPAPRLAGKERKAIEFMRAKFPDIPKEFFKVLFQYQILEKRSAATDWLKGVAIDEEDAARLQVSDRLRDSAAQLEQKSRNILSYLGILLAYYGQPLVVCFDRLENYDTEEKIRSLGRMVEFLVDKAKAMLPLVFVRGQQWEEIFTKKFNQQVITRLKTNEFQLKGCNENQSLEIIQSRLSSVFGPNESETLFPFDEEKLRETFRTRLHTPRQVIMMANQWLKQILDPEKTLAKPVFPMNKLEEEFAHQCQTICNDFNRYQPDRSRLRRALELYLSNNASQSGFEIVSMRLAEDSYLDFECEIRISGAEAVPAIFIIDIEQNNPYVRACLKRGSDFLEKFPNGKALYIRDARCLIPPPPKWKATNDLLQSFRDQGGYVLFLEEAVAAEWYALALLNYAVKEGDVTVIDADNQSLSVSSEELGGFVREKIHAQESSGFGGIGEILGK
ncbi:MAG: hypothetical protein B6245_22595 [Desulfobacteraceae bacterium 4572_88]|nr:MAG: hypothetical protein B6245_22595 [Desulfobacteraceae bacterium 4572_88]